MCLSDWPVPISKSVPTTVDYQNKTDQNKSRLGILAIIKALGETREIFNVLQVGGQDNPLFYNLWSYHRIIGGLT